MSLLGTYRPEQRKVRLSISCFQRSLKRVFDIVVSAVGLFLLLPLILLISSVILLESGRPVLRRHKRYNSMNVEFNIFRFRTAASDRQKNKFHEPLSTMTVFHENLCRSGIDRLPQLINVLRGELSIVGSHLFTTAPGKAIPPLSMADIKPGLIAWTHPHKDGDVSDKDKGMHYQVSCDLYYIENLSIIFDMKMIIRFLLSNMARRRDVMQ